MKKLEDMTNDELVDLFHGTLENHLAKVDFNIDLIPSNDKLNKTLFIDGGEEKK